MSQIDVNEKMIYESFMTVLNASDNVVLEEKKPDVFTLNKSDNNNLRDKEYNWRVISLQDGAELLRLEQRYRGDSEIVKNLYTLDFYAMGWHVAQYDMYAMDQENGKIGDMRTDMPKEIEQVAVKMKQRARQDYRNKTAVIGLSLLQQRIKQK